ncbi:MAG: molybdopterin dinucleotide binding domain-containing protein, partial [Anaerolineales bacterium]|nr:molybdopterin dinucleotide binding domain-containing protein [Anaerolineales bacterium]
HDMGKPNEIPAVPKYIQEWESPFRHCEEGALPDEATSASDMSLRGAVFATKQSPVQQSAYNSEEIASGEEQERPRNDVYTLQAIGHHTLARVHSTHANNDWLQEAFPQRIFINPIDAAARDIHDGELVRVWNERGELVIPARVTPRILPGVVDIPQGAWWKPDANGVDHGGCINVLTSHRWTPLAFATAQQTIMVEVEKTVDGGQQTDGLRSTVYRRGSS